MTKRETLPDDSEARTSWKTERKSQKKHLAYDSRLSLAFAAIAAMTVLVMVAILAAVWEGEFQKYARSNMERLAQSAADVFAERYEVAAVPLIPEAPASVYLICLKDQQNDPFFLRLEDELKKYLAEAAARKKE